MSPPQTCRGAETPHLHRERRTTRRTSAERCVRASFRVGPRSGVGCQQADSVHVLLARDARMPSPTWSPPPLRTSDSSATVGFELEFLTGMVEPADRGATQASLSAMILASVDGAGSNHQLHGYPTFYVTYERIGTPTLADTYTCRLALRTGLPTSLLCATKLMPGAARSRLSWVWVDQESKGSCARPRLQ